MENQNTKQQKKEILTDQAKKGNAGKNSLMIGLGFGIFAICLMMFGCTSTSRPSTSAEIAEQMKFQQKWDTAQKEAEQKWDSILIGNSKHSN